MSWENCKLGDIVHFNYGKALPARVRIAGDFPVFGSGGFVGTHIEPLVKGPGIVVGRKGTVGETYWVNKDFCPIDTTYYISSKNSETNFRYLYYLLKTLPLTKMNSDAAVPGLNRDNALNLKIKHCDSELQSRIAKTLSAYDDLIENNRQRIALLEESASILYREWFVHLRFPGHEAIKIIDGIPEGWDKLNASEALCVNPKTNWDKSKSIRSIPMSALSEKRMTIDKSLFEVREKPTSIKFQNDDTLFARITPCLENGKTGFVSCLKEDEVACGSTEFIVLRGTKISKYAVYLLAREESFRKNAIVSMVGSSGRQRVQPSCFDKYKVLVPSESVARLFDKTVSMFFKQVQVLDETNTRLAQARDILIPRLMDGRVEV